MDSISRASHSFASVVLTQGGTSATISNCAGATRTADDGGREQKEHLAPLW
jgi:hypothetical protein